jgi:hypothetical protein
LAKSVGIYLRCVGWGKWRLRQGSEAEFLYVGIAGVRVADSRLALLPDIVHFCEYAPAFWGNLLLSCWGLRVYVLSVKCADSGELLF